MLVDFINWIEKIDINLQESYSRHNIVEVRQAFCLFNGFKSSGVWTEDVAIANNCI